MPLNVPKEQIKNHRVCLNSLNSLLFISFILVFPRASAASLTALEATDFRKCFLCTLTMGYSVLQWVFPHLSTRCVIENRPPWTKSTRFVDDALTRVPRDVLTKSYFFIREATRTISLRGP